MLNTTGVEQNASSSIIFAFNLEHDITNVQVNREVPNGMGQARFWCALLTVIYWAKTDYAKKNAENS
jgi:hypothetical protein